MAGMEVDKEPLINSNNRTFTVQKNINQLEEVSISINGLMAIHTDDIENISGNIITIIDNLDIDWYYDSFVVFYDSL